MNNDKKKDSPYVEYTLLGSVGSQIVVSIFIGFGMGYWLDKWLNTKPAFMLIFTVLGVAAGFINVYRVIRKGMK